MRRCFELKLLARIVVSLLLAFLLTLPRVSLAEESENNGQDPTKPLSRFDLRYQYSNLSPAQNDNSHVVTLRGDKPIPLGDGYSLATRVDVPLIFSDVTSPDNEDGETQFGISDLLAQVLAIKVLNERFGYGAGTQLILDTASEQQFGGGKYRLVPTAAVRYGLPEISDGSFMAGIIRYDYDFADGRDSTDERGHISELQLAPLMNFALPDHWFFNLFPSTDIRYNFAQKRAADDGRWFVPFDFLIGRMVSQGVVASVEASFPVIDDYKLYDFKVDARVGFFF